MQFIHARRALLPHGWNTDVRVSITDGKIGSIEIGVAAQVSDESVHTAIPGMPNLHSHAFQRGMAGLAERRGPSTDSFWTWRELMYQCALTMTPDQLEAVAVRLYVEMLEAGFTRVGEFHYLHHDRDGQHYDNIGEMAIRIAAAASRTGIGLTLLPVFYAHSTFGGEPPGIEQRRFVSDLDGFAPLLEASRTAVASLDSAVVGVAPHSLRAVTPDELAAVCAMEPEEPIHIHVAEQQREIDDSIAWSGMRPVEWLLNHAEVDDRWCLIHATHMTGSEVQRLAASGAIAGLCPITEANLGDGTFAGQDFVQHGGRYGVGSDSNILIGIADELRQLEYSQRLAHRARNVMANSGGSTGRAMFDAAVRGGSVALGVNETGLAKGAQADIVTLTGELIDLLDGDGALDAWIFTNGVAVDDVWVGGTKVVEAGRHRLRENVSTGFQRAMRELLAGEER
jgi:formiminoglutamate deiminase